MIQGMLLALLLAAAAPDPGPRLALNIVLGDNVDAARGQMAMEKIAFKRADEAGVVLFFDHCPRPFQDARPCALVTNSDARVVALRGSVGPMAEKAARARFARAREDMARERRGPGKSVAPSKKELERVEWIQKAGDASVTAALWLVRLPKGHEVRFAYTLSP